MSKIHQITHPSPLVANKVNFFADYFEYLVEVIGKDDHLDIENHLSLVEKIQWQLDTNFEKCIPYVSNYLQHPYMRGEDSFIRMFNRHRPLFALFDKFRSLPISHRKKWLTDNTDFKKKIKSFKKTLKRSMVSKALFEIISFLRCKHELPEHRSEIVYCSKIIVSEFLLNGHSKKDLSKVFEKIMSRDVWEFPFPKRILTDAEKIAFLSTRTFDQQFQGIFNLLKAKPRSLYFLYRVFDLRVSDDFVFEYHNVTFYSPKHAKLKAISDVHLALRDGENKNDVLRNAIVAVVRLRYVSIDLAEATAKQMISEAVVYFNGALKASAHLDSNSYLGSTDLKVFHGVWRGIDNERVVDQYDIKTLRNNPYYFLKNVSGPAKRHFLKYERLFVKAMQSRSVEHFWQYLEALIPDDNGGEKRVRGVVSAVSLLTAEKSSADKVSNKISWVVQPFSARAIVFGLTDEQQTRYFDEMQKKGTISFARLRREIKHPFVEYLLNERDAKWSKQRIAETKQYYERMLLEAYSQRNAIIHKGEGYNKSLIGVNETLPWLVNRFRQALFQALAKHSKIAFDEVIDKEISRSSLLFL